MDAKRFEEEVMLSWGRCSKRGMERNMPYPSIVLGKKELTKRLSSNDVLINIFEQKVKNVSNIISGNYLFILTDPDAILLSVEYSGKIEEEMKEAEIIQGLSFSEESLGTNAISLAKHIKEPVYLEPGQHYCLSFQKWYCFALPLQVNNDIVGYLDVSTIKEPLKKELIAITELLEYQIGTEYKYMSENRRGDSDVFALTENQKQALKLLAEGMTEEAVAKEVNRSLNTIKYYKREIFKKLDVSSTREAIIKALKYKILLIDELDV